MDVGKTSQPLVPLRPLARSAAFSSDLMEPSPAALAPVSAQTLVPAPQPADEAKASTSAEDLRNRLRPLVEEINDKITATRQSQLKFSIDSQLGKVIVQVVDSTTDEVIRQIPPEEVLALQKRMAEMRGILFRREG